MDIGLSIRKSAYKATCCLLSKGGCYVRYPQIGGKSNKNPKRMKDLKENASKLYDNANYSTMSMQVSYVSKRKLC